MAGRGSRWRWRGFWFLNFVSQRFAPFVDGLGFHARERAVGLRDARAGLQSAPRKIANVGRGNLSILAQRLPDRLGAIWNHRMSQHANEPHGFGGFVKQAAHGLTLEWVRDLFPRLPVDKQAVDQRDQLPDFLHGR